MSDASPEEPAMGEFLLYQTDDGQTRVECRFAAENLWLSQVMMAELFLTSVPNVNLHLKNIYAEKELSPEATIKEYLIVRPEVGRHPHEQYARFEERSRLASESAAETAAMKQLEDIGKKLPVPKPGEDGKGNS